MPITCVPYPVSPYSASASNYTTTGSNVYTVPATAGGAAVSGVYVYLWGCGGAQYQVSQGGAGAFVSGFYSCSPGTKLIYVVGSVGGGGGYLSAGQTSNGGGSGGTVGWAYSGGFSGLFLSNAGGIAQSNAIAIAGGGGGSGWEQGGGGSNAGGGGGYPSGANGSTSNASFGYGGTQTAGGAPGSANATASVAGSALLGGTGGYMSGGANVGAGGGGWYGGGGGGVRQGGGGGSSYIGNVNGATGGIGLTSGAYTENGGDWNSGINPARAGGTTNQYYVANYGNANIYNTTYYAGLVVIVPAAAVTPTGMAAVRIPLTLSVYPSRTINSYTGNYILYTVPAGITSLIFNMWGAGGPGGGGGMVGGGGAYLTGTLATTPGEQLRIIVGCGGLYGSATYSNTAPDYQGAGGGGGGLVGNGGLGGGRSAIQKYIASAWTEVVTAGGGGSAGGNAGTYGGNAYYTGTSQSAGTTYGQGRIPTGGSASAGGLGTFTANTGAPYNGTQFTGGAASNAFNVSPVTGACGGGGGGGGYYGGGGGGRSGADTYGGGGGSSYYNATYVTNFSGSNGSGTTQIASTIPGYITNIGTGGLGNSSSSGNNGLVIFNVAYTKTQATTVPYPPIYTYFAYTGSNQTYTVPAGVTTITVYIWGAGGGQGVQTPLQEYGGAGAYVTGSLTVTPGSSFIVLVGGGGYSYNFGSGGSSQGGFGGGGNSSQQAGGGGRSAIQRTLTATISSASGNGSVVTYTTSAAHGLAVGQPVIITGLSPAGYNGTYIVASMPLSTTFTVSNTTSGTSSGTGTIVAELADAGGGGGGGGWATQQGGAAAWTGTASNGTSATAGGYGASQTAGGALRSGSQSDGGPGTALQGGVSTYQGGGGGGGYYGGGAGKVDSYDPGGGGGGSSYTALLTGASGANGSGALPPTTSFTGLPSGTATGGMVSSSLGTKGGNGYVIISYPRTT